MNRPPRWPIGEREHIQQRVSRARRVEQFAKNFLSKAFIPQIAVEPRFILVPRNHWLEQWEKDAIIDFHNQFPLEGYRRLTFMMLDRDIVAVSPSSTYRVLKGAGLLDCWKPKRSLKGSGFVQPLAPHEHWHVDVSVSTSPGLSSTSARCSTAARAQSYTGNC